MKKRQIRWFYFLTVDAKAAEAYLNAQAEQGWALTSVFAGVAVFHPSDRRDLRYCVEPFGGRRVRDDDDAGRQRRWDYLRLCEDGGWKLEEETTTLRIFSSLPGTDPAPIQTDPALDFEENWNKVLRDQQWSALLYGVLWLAWNVFLYHPSVFELFLSPVLLSSSLLLLFWLLCQIGYGIYLARRRGRCRRMLARDHALPVPAASGARLRGMAPLAALLLFCAILIPLFRASTPPALRLEGDDPRLASLSVVRAGDLDLSTGSALLWEDGSPLLSRVKYQTISPEAELVSERYLAAFPWLAALTARQLVSREEADRRSGHLHGPVTLSPAGLGFDEAWLGAVDGRQVLILRQGRTAALVEGPVDLTDPAVLSIIQTRLALEVTP